MRRFSVQPKDISGSSAIIRGEEANHIQHVLRLSPGHVIQLFDGTGTEYQARIDTFASDKIQVTILGKIESKTESPIQLIVAQALLKDKKMDRLVRQLTELGITHFIPFTAERSIARPDANRLAKRIDRWKKIAKESLKQCRRTQIPQIGPALSFAETLDFGKTCDMRILFWEDSKIILNHSDKNIDVLNNKILLILGPEGGFSEKEAEQAQQADFSIASLGPRILKAETAPIAACTIIQYLFGDMGNKFLDKDSGIHY